METTTKTARCGPCILAEHALASHTECVGRVERICEGELIEAPCSCWCRENIDVAAYEAEQEAAWERWSETGSTGR